MQPQVAQLSNGIEVLLHMSSLRTEHVGAYVNDKIRKHQADIANVCHERLIKRIWPSRMK